MHNKKLTLNNKSQMQTFKIFILVIFLASTLISCGQKVKSASLKTEIYCDHCTECESCKARVEKALLSNSAITSAEMKVNEKMIIINYDPSKIDEQKIKQIIAKTGYSAGDVQADPTAYDNLDDCCKKK